MHMQSTASLLLSFILLLGVFSLALLVSGDSICSWTIGEFVLDLSSLEGLTLQHSEFSGSSYFTYSYTPCQNSLECSNSAGASYMAIQSGDGCHALAEWSSEVAPVYANHSFTFNYSVIVKRNLTLKYVCGNSSASVESVVETSSNGYDVYTMTIESKYACTSTTSDLSSSPSSVSSVIPSVAPTVTVSAHQTGTQSLWDFLTEHMTYLVATLVLLAGIVSMIMSVIVVRCGWWCHNRHLQDDQLKSKKPEANHWMLIKLSLQLLDFYTDICFLVYLSDANLEWLFGLYLVSLVLGIVANIIIIVKFYRIENDKNKHFHKWFLKHSNLVVVITTFAIFDIDLLRLLSSNVFGMKTFNAPMRWQSIRFVKISHIFAISIENFPQLLITAIVNSQNGWGGIGLLTFIVASVDVIMMMVSVLLWYLLSPSKHARRSNPYDEPILKAGSQEVVRMSLSASHSQ